MPLQEIKWTPVDIAENIMKVQILGLDTSVGFQEDYLVVEVLDPLAICKICTYAGKL